MKLIKFFIFILTLATAVVSCSKDDETIPDITAPIITLIDSSVVNVLQGTTYIDAGATATDSIDGDITASIVVVNNVNADVVGTYTVTYNVSDAAGNAAAEVIRTVNVILPDESAPIITLLESSEISIRQGDTYIDAGATAYDNVDGDISGSIVVVNNVNTDVIGTYTVTYNVSDAAGNNAEEVIRTVNVVSSVSGNKYETTYAIIQMSGSMELTLELKTKAELVEYEMYQVLEFKSNGEFLTDDVQYGTWSQINSTIKIDDGSEIVEFTVEGNILKISQTETSDGDTYTIEMHYTKM